MIHWSSPGHVPVWGTLSGTHPCEARESPGSPKGGSGIPARSLWTLLRARRAQGWGINSSLTIWAQQSAWWHKEIAQGNWGTGLGWCLPWGAAGIPQEQGTLTPSRLHLFAVWLSHSFFLASLSQPLLKYAYLIYANSRIFIRFFEISIIVL